MAMTEIDFSRSICPDVRRFTLDASTTKATQVNIPDWCRKITVRPEGRGCRVAFVSDSDNIHSDFIKLAADTPSEFTFTDGHKRTNKVDKVYIANLVSYGTTMNISVMLEGEQ